MIEETETPVTGNAPAAEATPTTSLPAAKVTAKVAPPVFTPAAVYLTAKPRDRAIAAINDLKPPGNPRPEVLAAAKACALALIDTFPAADAIETKIEITGATGHQVLVQVIPSAW